MTDHNQHQKPQASDPHSTAMAPQIVLTLGECNLPYWGYDTPIDGRAEALWALCVTIDDAQTLADGICNELGIARVNLLTNNPSTEILDEILADPDLLESVIEASADGEYREPIDSSPATIIFDGVLTDRGEHIPLQLVLHELAHHVDWHEGGGLSGHDAQPFGDALTLVIDHACELLGLRPHSPVAADDATRYNVRINAYRQKYAAWIRR